MRDRVYMGKRGTEGLHNLKKNSFAILTNSDGREYLELKYNESTKKSNGTGDLSYFWLVRL